jgi:hypothetical protein
MPKSALPEYTRRVYPTAANRSARPVMFTGMPESPVKGFSGSKLAMSTFCALTWIGLRPDWMALREGEQYLYA